MKTDVEEIEIAVQFAANVLGLPLDWVRETDQITGSATMPVGWFGSKLRVPVTVIDSLVDERRGIVLLAVTLVGHLGAVLLVDAQEKSATLHLVDGAKLGMTKKIPDSPLPEYWVRGRLYRNIVEALQVTFTASYLTGRWRNERRGSDWMREYLEKKQENARNAKSFMP